MENEITKKYANRDLKCAREITQNIELLIPAKLGFIYIFIKLSLLIEIYEELQKCGWMITRGFSTTPNHQLGCCKLEGNE